MKDDISTDNNRKNIARLFDLSFYPITQQHRIIKLIDNLRPNFPNAHNLPA